MHLRIFLHAARLVNVRGAERIGARSRRRAAISATNMVRGFSHVRAGKTHRRQKNSSRTFKNFRTSGSRAKYYSGGQHMPQPYLPHFSDKRYSVGWQAINERPHLMAAVGKCIGIWSHIDNEIGGLFGTL